MSLKRKTVVNILLTLAFVFLPQFASAQTNTFPSSGNAGVGTTTPATALEVRGGAVTSRVTTTGTTGANGKFQLFSADITNNPFGEMQLFAPTGAGSEYLRFNVGNSSGSIFADVLTISRFGNVGIGTANPLSQLHFGTLLNAGLRTYTSSDSNHGFLFSSYMDTTSPYRRYGDIVAMSNQDGISGGSTIRFLTNPHNSFTAVERMRIDYLGNVGVGTTAPGGPIDVRDSSGRQILWNMSSHGHSFLNANGGNVHVAGNLYFNGTNWNRFNTAAAGGMWWAGSDGTLGVLQTPAGANPVAAFNWNFFIGATGNVGIGSNAPNYKLDVQGGQINASGGLCIAGDCKTSWSQVGSGGSSQWGGTSGNPIYYTGGNVGIGTTSPSTRLHVSAGDSSFALFGPNTTWGGSLAVGSGADFVTPVSGRAQVLSSNGNLHLDAGTNQYVYIGWLTASNTIINGQGGNVGIGNSSPTEKLHVTGNGKFTGNLTVDGNINAKYQDLAEWVPSAEQLSAGTVVVLDTTKSNQVISSGTAYDTRVAGVISAQPGITLGESGEGKVLVATTGRVRVKVDASRGAIQIGDLLVTSDVTGVAMKSEPVEFAGRKMHMPGTIIGKALEPLAKGSGEILVLLSLQ